MNCTECNSTNLRKSGKVFRYRNGVRVKVQQWQCKDCGKVFTPKDEAGTPVVIKPTQKEEQETPNFTQFVNDDT